MENLDVSIIIPMKDTCDYIGKCIDSISSNYLDNLEYEVIIVDDNSKLNIQERFKNSKNVKYYYLDEHIGTGGARNYGLRKSSGEFIIFIDSDDWISLDYIYNGISLMKQAQADLGMYSLKRYYDNKNIESVFKCQYTKPYILNPDIAFKMLTYEYNFGIKVIPSSTNKIYKRNLLIDNSIYFPEKLKFEDLLFSVKAILSSNKLVCIPESIYYHYKRTGSIVQSFDKDNINDLYKIFVEIRQYLIDISKYDQFKNNYYKFWEHFYNLVIRQIFQYVNDDLEKKNYMLYSINTMKNLIDIDDYLQFLDAETLRTHLQPYIKDTFIY